MPLELETNSKRQRSPPSPFHELLLPEFRTQLTLQFHNLFHDIPAPFSTLCSHDLVSVSTLLFTLDRFQSSELSAGGRARCPNDLPVPIDMQLVAMAAAATNWWTRRKPSFWSISASSNVVAILPVRAWSVARGCHDRGKPAPPEPFSVSRFRDQSLSFASV